MIWSYPVEVSGGVGYGVSELGWLVGWLVGWLGWALVAKGSQG